MTNQEFLDIIGKDIDPRVVLSKLASKMRKDEAAILISSAANAIPTTVAWNVLRDVINRARVAAEESVDET